MIENVAFGVEISLVDAGFDVVVFKKLAKRVGRVEVEVGRGQKPSVCAARLELLEGLDKGLEASVCHKRHAEVKREALLQLCLEC